MFRGCGGSEGPGFLQFCPDPTQGHSFGTAPPPAATQVEPVSSGEDIRELFGDSLLNALNTVSRDTSQIFQEAHLSLPQGSMSQLWAFLPWISQGPACLSGGRCFLCHFIYLVYCCCPVTPFICMAVPHQSVSFIERDAVTLFLHLDSTWAQASHFPGMHIGVLCLQNRNLSPDYRSRAAAVAFLWAAVTVGNTHGGPWLGFAVLHLLLMTRGVAHQA